MLAAFTDGTKLMTCSNADRETYTFSQSSSATLSTNGYVSVSIGNKKFSILQPGYYMCIQSPLPTTGSGTLNIENRKYYSEPTSLTYSTNTRLGIIIHTT